MNYDFSNFKKEIDKIKEWLKSEYSGLHSGRVSSNLLDKISVDSYGAKALISHVSSVSVEDARTLRISPYDQSQVQDIEKALQTAGLGASVLVDDSGLRMVFPEMTTESKQSMVKIVKDKFEDSKISLRKEREKVWDDIQNKQKDGELTEDDKFRIKDELQKFVEEGTGELEQMQTKKESDILN